MPREKCADKNDSNLRGSLGDVLEKTPLQDIDSKIKLSKSYFKEKQLKISHEYSPSKADLKFRLLQLKKLYFAIKDLEEEIVDALHCDLHRSRQEAIVFEVVPVINDVLHMIESLPKWTKPIKLRDNAPPYMFGKIIVEKIARGSVLVIAPFNFPILLALAPVAYAIAAGNSVILKPSEMTPTCAVLLEKILKAADLPVGLCQVVQGAIQQSQRLLESGKFDMIFFTGSPKVGSIIAQEAAKTLTPCVLELGGKSPVFITENFRESHFRTALKRIFFSAFGNSGQICVSPDYVLVHESIYSKVVNEAKSVLRELYPEMTEHVEYTHMIHEQAYNNAVSKLDSTSGIKFTVENQQNDATKLLIPPSLVFDVKWDDPLMNNENFAPILPFIKYSNLDETIDQVLEYHDTPLVQYIFSDEDQEVQHILTRLRSGDCIIGDTLIHVGISDAPFGGIGQSGYGSHGGVWGYNAFSHERVVFKQPFWMDALLAMRYPPYTPWKTKFLEFATEKKPWFDRDGNDKLTLFQWVILSGALISIAAIYNVYFV